MARDILDLGADVFDDTQVAKKRRISPKKRNYIIGLSCLSLFLAGAITFTVIAANTWLLDMTNLNGLQFYYSPKDPNDPNAPEPTLTLYQLDSSIKYPSSFRIPEKVKGLKVTAIAPDAFNGHTEIEDVIFTSYIDTIGDKAFTGCTNIKNFKWNKALRNIGNEVFNDTAFYKKLEEDSERAFSIPNTGVLIYLGKDYFKTDNIALISDSFTEQEKAEVIAKYGIDANNFIKFSDIGRNEGDVGTTAFVAGLFAKNEKISYADFPEFLTRLGAGTFKDCKNLKGISFAHSEIKSITENNFSGCESLSGIKFSESITEIGDKAFENTKITELPEGLDKITSFGKGVFANCKKLEKVYYPDTEQLNVVPDSMFENCSSLKEFFWADDDNTGGSYIKTIGEKTFANTAIEEFYVPASVTLIKDEAFRGCKQLEKVFFYGNPNEIYDESTIAKDEYGVYEYETEISGGNFDIQYFDTQLVFNLGERDPFVVSPDEDGNYKFFIENPSSEFTIESASFTLTAEQFGMIKKAIIEQREEEEKETRESSVTSDSSSEEEEEKEDDKLYVMVQDDTKFFSLFFEEIEEEIGEKKFVRFVVTFKSTTSYTIDDNGAYHLGYLAGISDIRQQAFQNCTKLSTIALFGDDGFDDVYTPDNVFTLPKSLTWLSRSLENLSEDMNIFEKTAGTKIYIDSHVRKIGGYVYSNISNLEEVEFSPHSTLQTIGEEAFSSNKKMKTISLPKTVTKLGPAVFYKCTGLETIDIKETNIESLETELFSGCSALTHIDLPSTVTKIAEKAFDSTTSLDYVVVPAKVNMILKNAFVKCKNNTRGLMPIYLNITPEAFNKNPGFNKDFHDATCEHYFLLEAGQEKVEGYNYWNGDAANPQVI